MSTHGSFQKQRAQASPGNAYEGIAVFSSRGTHEACAELATRYCPPPAKALDIAAGQGAFARRLLDLGYHVTANDLDHSSWSVPAIKPYAEDLNGDFSRTLPGPFDLVAAIAIIEHLENPFHFLRECKALMTANGVFVLVVPNLLDYDSRHKLLRKGVLHQYSPEHTSGNRHISLLPSWLIEDHFKREGFVLKEKRFVGVKDYTGLGWRKYFHPAACRVASWVLSGTSWQELAHNNVAYVLMRSKETQ